MSGNARAQSYSTRYRIELSAQSVSTRSGKHIDAAHDVR